MVQHPLLFDRIVGIMLLPFCAKKAPLPLLCTHENSLGPSQVNCCCIDDLGVVFAGKGANNVLWRKIPFQFFDLRCISAVKVKKCFNLNGRGGAGRGKKNSCQVIKKAFRMLRHPCSGK